jgi:hypothetical protein
MIDSEVELSGTSHDADTRHPSWSPKSLDIPICRVIQLKERSLIMLKKDLILRNPLRLLGHENETIIRPGNFGAVLARHGVGKTAFVVQIALNSLLQQKNVLHISLNEPVGKVSLWYQEVFEQLAHQYQVPQIDQVWDAIVPHRFIMTFQVEVFSAPKLKERLTDLTAQRIFLPDMIIIDGLPFDTESHAELKALKSLAVDQSLPIWFTVTTHRHEDPAGDGLPVQLSPVHELFDAAIKLQPVKDTIHIKALKGRPEAGEASLILDPATMLIQSS